MDVADFLLKICSFFPEDFEPPPPITFAVEALFYID
jgi:hypothetical protein